MIVFQFISSKSHFKIILDGSTSLESNMILLVFVRIVTGVFFLTIHRKIMLLMSVLFEPISG